jgi:predicted O-methyltransferase YrrM
VSRLELGAGVEAYVEAHSTPGAPALRALAEETRATLSSPGMLSGPVAGRLLEFLTWLARPQLVLELGTYSGYSALTMAAVLPAGARIVTCEVSEEHAAFAQRHIDASPFADRIEIRLGPALDTIAALDGPFDLVFIDADKRGYPDYYEAVVPKLAPHGLVVIDNTLQGGEVVAPEREQARLMAAFNDRVMADPRTVNVLLTVRDGMTLVRRA